MSDARFVHGGLMRHIVVMSSTSAIGLMALFLVDLLDMYFISLLGHAELAAAVGFAGSLVFFNTSVSIGASIAMGALVSRSLGARDMASARRFGASAMLFSLIIGSLISMIMVSNVEALLALLGAKGVVADKATDYLCILMPSAPILAMAMAASAALRATGDAKRAMLATLSGGIVNAILDPLFIFGFNMGIEGAAAASVVARISIFVIAAYGMIYHHGLMARPRWQDFQCNLKPIAVIALPAILANIATPFGNAFVTRFIANFGTDYVAGFAVIGRIIPVAFCLLFAISGAVGPIIGQNFGAQRFDRVHRTLFDALTFAALYSLVVSLILWLLRDPLIYVFGLRGDSAELFALFCPWIAMSFAFNGALFIANASFNNLNRSYWATLLNAGKATIGTIPFVIFGGNTFGAEGVLIGQAVGSILFGIAGFLLAARRVHQLKVCHERREEEAVIEPAMPLTPFCSSRAYMMEDAQLEVEAAEDTDTKQL